MYGGPLVYLPLRSRSLNTILELCKLCEKIIIKFLQGERCSFWEENY